MSIAFSTFAQQIPIDENESQQVLLSNETQKLIKMHDELFYFIDKAIKNGNTLEQIEKSALLKATKNEGDFYLDVFGSEQNGNEYLAKLAAAKNNFISKYPFINKYPNEFLCKICPTDITVEIHYFFSNYNALNSQRFASLNNGDGPPTCGSYWNQVKLLGCVAGCSLTTGGLGTAFCGWMCWCTFCNKNSKVATTICAQ